MRSKEAGIVVQLAEAKAKAAAILAKADQDAAAMRQAAERETSARIAAADGALSRVLKRRHFGPGSRQKAAKKEGQR